MNLNTLIDAALAEDIGSGDITSQLLIPEHARAIMRLVAKEKLVVAGTQVAAAVFLRMDGALQVEKQVIDGACAAAGDILVTAQGNVRALLAAERTALNLMQRMCGVATLTRAYVDAVAGTKAVILDTRKTMPGLRALDKYAVTCGGGQNHRMGLWDAVMVKDNHLALCSGSVGAGSLEEMIVGLKRRLAGEPMPIIVECDTLDQVREALKAQPDRILLDNMNLQALREAVRMAAGRLPLEASGGVTLATVRAIAETGVDYISVGALTHSARAMDIGAEILL